MKNDKSFILPHLRRVAPLIIATVAMACTGCHGPNRAMRTSNPVATPATRTVDIQQLIDEAENGGLVQVPAGRYILPKGLLVANRKGLRIVFENDAAILVEDVTQNVLSITGSENISIENANLGHLTPLTEYECHGNVVDIRDSTNIRIMACDINGCGAVGVYACNSAGIVVDGCHVHRNTFNAFYLHDCRGVRIERNVIEHNANLMQAYDVNGLQMSHNVIKDNGGYWEETYSDSAGHSP